MASDLETLRWIQRNRVRWSRTVRSGSLISALFSRAGGGTDRCVTELNELFDMRTNGEFARDCKAIRIENGVVFVRASDPSTAYAMRLRWGRVLRETAKQSLGNRKACDVRFFWEEQSG